MGIMDTFVPSSMEDEETNDLLVSTSDNQLRQLVTRLSDMYRQEQEANAVLHTIVQSQQVWTIPKPKLYTD